MPPELLNIIMCNGSRHFGDLPASIPWHRLRKHIKRLKGAEITNFITDYITEAWLDFSYCGQQFSVNNQFGSYWFFVKDSNCPDNILQAVLRHCELLLRD